MLKNFYSFFEKNRQTYNKKTKNVHIISYENLSHLCLQNLN